MFATRLGGSAAGAPLKSAKSRLQEWAQREHHLKPSYQLTAATGPAHRQAFEVAVSVAGVPLGAGHGSSRQRAEEKAAIAALVGVDQGDPVATRDEAS